MQLPSTYKPLHCAAPVPVYASLSLLCRYRVLMFFLYFSFFIYLSIYLSIRSYVYFIYAYVCIYVLYLSGTFLAHVLRPNSFHRCSNFTSHCRNVTSLPQKRFRGHAHAFYFPACFQVQLTYFHTHVTFSFRSPPLSLKFWGLSASIFNVACQTVQPKIPRRGKEALHLVAMGRNHGICTSGFKIRLARVPLRVRNVLRIMN